MADEINPASALAKQRWKKATKADKKENSRKMLEGRQAKLTPERRSEIASNAAKARHAKKKTAKRKPKAD